MKLPRTRVITLRDTPGRTERITEHLRDRGVEWQPYEGIDARRWALTTTNTYEIDNPGSGFVVDPKHVGLGLAHHGLWVLQKELGLSELTVLEDDCVLSEDWEERYTEARSVLPTDWDFLMLGSAHCQYRYKEHVAGPLWSVYWPLGTHAYVLNAKAIPVLLETQRHAGMPIDLSLAIRSWPLLNVYTILPRIATQHLTPLDE